MKNLLNLSFALSICVFIALGCTPQSNTSTSNTTAANTNQSNSSAPASSTEKPIQVQAKALTKEYDDNELAADQKYKGKTLEVSGKVSNIAETLGQITAQLEGHTFTKSVMCSFDASEKDNVMKLKKGQIAVFVGTGDGSTGGLYVGLQNCKIK